jgi:NADPH:quinone reductase-like Zn-dependent oxidoreductase
LAYLSPSSVIIGCNYSGVVVKLGEDLINPGWKIGDQSAGMAHGGKFTDKGAFAGMFAFPLSVCYTG